MKNIKFLPLSKEAELLTSPPKPAKKYIPEWYKKIEAFDPKNLTFMNGKITNNNVKMCIPFLDSLTTGYIQETWTDINIKSDKDGNVFFNYPSGPKIMDIRQGSPSIELDKSYYSLEFVWQEQWSVEMPKGWSVIYTHPFNNLNLPFTSATAVIDSDKYNHTASGQYPFYIKKGFEGIIPAGTPMYQIIPFKRESWKSEIVKFDQDETIKKHSVINRKFYGAYKDLFWVKKTYN